LARALAGREMVRFDAKGN
jgi:hypothetical protein